MKRFHNFAIQLLCAISTLIVFTPIVAQAQANDPRLGDWDRQLQELRRTHKLPGLAAALVIDHQPVWSKGYGFADRSRSGSTRVEGGKQEKKR